MTTEVVLTWLLFNILIWIYANKLNRFGFGYFILSGFFSPVIIGILLLIIGKRK